MPDNCRGVVQRAYLRTHGHRPHPNNFMVCTGPLSMSGFRGQVFRWATLGYIRALEELFGTARH